jgi:hypothetical protein
VLTAAVTTIVVPQRRCGIANFRERVLQKITMSSNGATKNDLRKFFGHHAGVSTNLDDTLRQLQDDGLIQSIDQQFRPNHFYKRWFATDDSLIDSSKIAVLRDDAGEHFPRPIILQNGSSADVDDANCQVHNTSESNTREDTTHVE